MEKKISRGIRNNNPGNIRHNPANKWHGIADRQSDKEFVQFRTMAHGVRALANVLLTYFDRYKIDTIEGVCERWAPRDADNNKTDAHIKAVRQEAKAYEGEHFNFHAYEDIERIVRGIIRAENGVDGLLMVNQANIDAGLKLAGIEPPQKPLVKSRTMQGASIAAISGISLAIEAINNTADHIGNWYPWLGTLIMLGGLGYVFYARTSDHKRGK